MKYRIHFTLPDGTEDSVVVTGETVDDIQRAASAEIEKRNASDPWSEEL